jgi:hypothetical protein
MEKEENKRRINRRFIRKKVKNNKDLKEKINKLIID